MTALFLSPHNDDETLFGAFTLLRHRPHVVVVLRSHVQEHRHGFGVTAAEREAETQAAMGVLDCEWEQWPYLDYNPDWPAVERSLRNDARADLWDRVFAPTVETGGHDHHSQVGELADRVFGPERVTHYMTYVDGRVRTQGVPVPYEREWVGLKLCALSQYESQIRLESTGHHFMQPLDEWYQS